MKTLVRMLCFVLAAAAAEAEQANVAPLAPIAPVSAYALTQADVETVASEQLAAKGAASRVRAMLQGNRSNIIYQAGKPLSAKLASLTFDKNTSRWNANLLIMSGDQVVTAMPITGRYDEIVLRPVLKRQVRNGEIISEADVDTMEFPIAVTRSDEVTDVKQLIGMGPRTAISPHRPIHASEIMPPALVHKNSVVTMRWSGGGMEITTNGQAMNDGAKDDTVDVKNLTSKNVVRARVVDAYTVSVSPRENPQLAGVPYGTTN